MAKFVYFFLLLLVPAYVSANAWNAYVVNLIAQSKDASGVEHCDEAAIIGLDGGQEYTTTSNSNVIHFQSGEASVIATAMKNKDLSTFRNNKIWVDNVGYQFLRAQDDNTIVFGKLAGAGEITIQSSKTAVVLGHTPPGKQMGNTNKAVNVIAEYLKSLNY